VTVLQANFDFDRTLADPDALLDRYTTLTGWSEALLEAGADRVIVLQRFHRHAIVRRNGVEYHFGRTRDIAAADLRSIEVAHVNGLNFPVQTHRLRGLLRPRAPILVQDHATGLPPARATSRAVRRWGFRPVDAFLFTAGRLADPWRAAHIIHRRHHVYEVLEASTTLRPMARAAAREASGITGSPALLWVGRLNANKDPLTVLAGFERVVDDGLWLGRSAAGCSSAVVRVSVDGPSRPPRRLRPARGASGLLQRCGRLRPRQPPRRQRLRVDRSVRVRRDPGGNRDSRVSRHYR
jgi:glycosyltransferase involved in cell wall biosynthesis